MPKKNKSGIRSFGNKIKKSLGLAENDEVQTVEQKDESPAIAIKEKLLAFCRQHDTNIVKVYDSDTKERLSGLTFDSLGRAKLLTETSIEIFGFLDRLIRYSKEAIEITINDEPLMKVIG